MKSLHQLDGEQLRVLGDPLRQRILSELCEAERTTAELADRLPDTPSNLYYHVAKLEEAGLVELVRTEPRRGATAKYYRAVARRFDAAPDVLAGLGAAGAGSGVVAAVGGAMRATLSELGEAAGAGLLRRGEGAPDSVITRLRLRVPRARAEEVSHRLRELLEDLADVCHAPDGEASGGAVGDAASGGLGEYSLLVMFFEVPGSGGGGG